MPKPTDKNRIAAAEAEASSEAIATAIKAAGVHTLRESLALLVRDSVTSKTLVANLLLRKERPKRSGCKRAIVPRYETCVNCDGQYGVECIGTEACMHHDGELEVDDEAGVWADHDEFTHGPIDTQENEDAYPEAFIWSCCGGDGDSQGCQTEEHGSITHKE